MDYARGPRPSIMTRSSLRHLGCPDANPCKEHKNSGRGISGSDDEGANGNGNGGMREDKGWILSSAMSSVVGPPTGATPASPLPPTESSRPATTSSSAEPAVRSITAASDSIDALASSSTSSVPIAMLSNTPHPMKSFPCIACSQAVQRELNQLSIALGSVAAALGLVVVCSVGWVVYVKRRLQTKKRRSPSWQRAPPIKLADLEAHRFLSHQLTHVSTVRPKPKEHRVLWMDVIPRNTDASSNTAFVVAVPPAPRPIHRSGGSQSNLSTDELPALRDNPDAQPCVSGCP
ncbi:hypothetical protein AB1N83_000666 [Pleurotus pulmonarius]